MQIYIDFNYRFKKGKIAETVCSTVSLTKTITNIINMTWITNSNEWMNIFCYLDVPKAPHGWSVDWKWTLQAVNMHGALCFAALQACRKSTGLGHCHPFVELRCHLLVHRGTCPRAGKWPRWCHITSKAPSPCKDKREVFVHKVYDPWDTRLLLPLSGGLLTDQEMLCVPTEVLKWAVNIKSKTILVQTAA